MNFVLSMLAKTANVKLLGIVTCKKVMMPRIFTLSTVMKKESRLNIPHHLQIIIRIQYLCMLTGLGSSRGTFYDNQNQKGTIEGQFVQ